MESLGISNKYFPILTLLFLLRSDKIFNLFGKEVLDIKLQPDKSKIGEIRNNNSGTPMKIIDYKSTSDITI